MIYIFLGPPGCGKGSQAQILSEKLGIKAFSAGDLLRQEIEEGSSIGLQVKSVIEQGHYVPDQLIWDLVCLHVAPYSDKDIIIDGFPRTIGQAELLVEWTNCSKTGFPGVTGSCAMRVEPVSTGIQNDALDPGSAPCGHVREDSLLAIYFDIDPDILLERILHRTMCGQCGAIYNLKTNPPKQNSICDVCGSAEFKTRADDDAEVFKQRLQQDTTKSKPVVAFFEARGLLCKVDASKDISTVTEQVLSIMSRESHGAY
jgi:adenylate kinase